MKDFDAHAYSITVRRAVIDGEKLFWATVAELPDVEAFEKTAVNARAVVIDAIETLYRLAKEEGSKFPEPADPQVEYRGRVTLRLPRSLHRKAALQAGTEGVSLNAYLASLIAEKVGERAGRATTVHILQLKVVPTRTPALEIQDFVMSTDWQTTQGTSSQSSKKSH